MPGAAQGFLDADSVAKDTGADLDIFQCSGCGLVQLAAEPVAYYREVIRAAGISPVLREDKCNQFSEFIGRHGLQGKKVIEVGCGRGEFLSILNEMPVEAYGIEFSEPSVAACVGNGLKVLRGYPEEGGALLPGAPFDAFFLLMFLEHMPDPAASLRFMASQLTRDAVGLIEVPSFDMMVRNRLFSEFIADHLFYFSADTLARTLSMHGFEVISLKETRDGYVLSAEVRKRAPMDLSGFLGDQEKVTGQIRGFVSGFSKGKVAVWGAGHQALAILSMSGIADSIRYVVDSAPFKQGKFTPASHLPVVPPNTLKSEPVDAIIVMAGGYAWEVAEILQKDYGNSLAIAVLGEKGFTIL
jgi:SAM-dependent methyltransferase